MELTLELEEIKETGTKYVFVLFNIITSLSHKYVTQQSLLPNCQDMFLQLIYMNIFLLKDFLICACNFSEEDRIKRIWWKHHLDFD